MSQLGDLLLRRHSFRKFTSQKVDDGLLKEMLTKAARTSTCGNMQLYSVVITKDEDVKKKLGPAHFCQPAFVNAPVILTFCADYNRFTKWCEHNNATPGYDNLESFMSASVDTIALAQTFSLLAEEAGLGLCYLGTTTYNPKQVAEALNLPKLVFPVVTLALGYPEGEPELTDRIAVDGFIHEQQYHDYADADIDKIFAYKDDIPANKAFVEENKKQNLAQVFTDIRYTKKDNEFFSKQLLDFIKEQNFLK